MAFNHISVIRNSPPVLALWGRDGGNKSWSHLQLMFNTWFVLQNNWENLSKIIQFVSKERIVLSLIESQSAGGLQTCRREWLSLLSYSAPGRPLCPGQTWLQWLWLFCPISLKQNIYIKSPGRSSPGFTLTDWALDKPLEREVERSDTEHEDRGAHVAGTFTVRHNQIWRGSHTVAEYELGKKEKFKAHW